MSRRYNEIQSADTGQARRRIITLLVVIMAVLLGLALALPWLVDLNHYRGPVTDKIQQQTGGEVNLGNITWGIASGLWLQVEDIKIRNATAFNGDMDLPRVIALSLISMAATATSQTRTT